MISKIDGKVLLKAADDIFLCGRGCEADFVIKHDSNIECSQCGTSYGYLSDSENVRIKKDETKVHEVEISYANRDEAVDVIAEVLSFFEEAQENQLIITECEKQMINKLDSLRKKILKG